MAALRELLTLAKEIAPRTIYLSTDKGERRSSGTYYTPDHIVDQIVSSTLGRLCKRVEDEITSDIKRLRQEIREARPAEQRALEEELAKFQGSFGERVLALKVIDPSMGSGHFLVRACQYLAEEIATSPYTAIYEQGPERRINTCVLETAGGGGMLIRSRRESASRRAGKTRIMVGNSS